MPLLAIAVLAAGTYAFRIAGPALRNRLELPVRLEYLLTVAAAVLLIALAASSTFTEDRAFAGWARPTGVLVAGALALRRAPFPLIVIAAATTTALLRLLGVP